MYIHKHTYFLYTFILYVSIDIIVNGPRNPSIKTDEPEVRILSFRYRIQLIPRKEGNPKITSDFPSQTLYPEAAHERKSEIKISSIDQTRSQNIYKVIIISLCRVFQ